MSNSPMSMTTLIPTLTLVHRSFLGPNRGPHTELPHKPTSQQEPHPAPQPGWATEGNGSEQQETSVCANDYPEFQDGTAERSTRVIVRLGALMAQVPRCDPLFPQWEGNGNPLQGLCLNPTDRGACWATVPGFTKSLSDSHFHFPQHPPQPPGSLGHICCEQSSQQGSG